MLAAVRHQFLWSITLQIATFRPDACAWVRINEVGSA